MLRRVALISVLVLLVFNCRTISRVRESPDQPVNLMLTTLPAGKDPQRYKGYVAPKYKEAIERSLYLNMRDGVKIAITVVLPKDLPPGEKIPAVMNMTRYWRARAGQLPILGGIAVVSSGESVRKPNPSSSCMVTQPCSSMPAARALRSASGARRFPRTRSKTMAKWSGGSSPSHGRTEMWARLVIHTKAIRRCG